MKGFNNPDQVAIRCVRQKELDYSKWDKCIKNSINGNTYALSWYLDIVAPQWEGIVEADYISVMPLIYRRKNFIYEIFPPKLSGQLGVFSSLPINNHKLRIFCDAIPERFRKIKIYLNRQNSSTFKYPTKHTKSIFELDLISPYSKAQSKYSKTIQNSIRLAKKHRFFVMKHLSISELDKYFVAEALERKGFYDTILRKVISHLVQLHRIEISGVYSPENMLCAIACFVKSNNNVILLYCHSIKQKSSINSTHLLLNSFMESYSSRNITLSFDYIDENWNADLYRSFGAINTYSNCIDIDRRLKVFKWMS